MIELEFSEILRSYLNEHNITMADLSRNTGIERFALSRYVNGKRVPSKPETVEAIADALQMTYAEKNAFLEAFDKAFYGDSVVNSYNYMKNLFNSLNNLSGDSFDEDEVANSADDNSDFQLLKSKYDITKCVFRLFESALEGDGTVAPKVEILVSHRPVCEEIQKTVLSVFRGTDVNVRQVVRLEGNVNKCYVNIEILQDILPIGFAVKNYHAYYYYASVFEHSEKFTMLPNMIAVNDVVLFIDGDMESGIMTSKPDLVSYAVSHFESILFKCSPLIERCDQIGGYFGKLYPTDLNTYENRNVYNVYRYPCIAYATTRELLLKYIKDTPGKQQFIDAFTSTHGYFKGDEFINPSGESHHFINIVTKEGFWEQIREGTCVELPPEWYDHMPLDVMQGFLKRMIILMKSGFAEFRFLNTDFGLPRNIQFICYDMIKEIRFLDTGTFGINQVRLQENSMFNAFHMFVDFLEAKKMLCTAEESLAFMEDAYRQIDTELKNGKLVEDTAEAG